MSKEGLKFLGLFLTLIVLIGGFFIVKPFPWIRAGERQLQGEISSSSNKYSFTGDNMLIVTDLREIKGQAVSADDIIYFDSEGAEVKIDQLGYWYGQAFSPKLGWIKFGVSGDKVVSLLKGELSGTVSADDGTILKFTGEGDWQAYQLADVLVSNELMLAENTKKLIEPKIIGLGGVDLYDVQKKWISRNPAIVVDEYGYVTASQRGYYQNALILRIGDKEEAITLQVIPTNQIESYEPRVVTTDRGDVNIKITFEVEVDKVDSMRLVKGAGEKKDCSLVGALEKVKTIEAVCNFVAEDTGFWNIAITFDGREQVYTDSINVLGTQNTLNVTGNSVVTFTDVDGNSKTSSDRSVFTDSVLTYDVNITFPSFVVGNNYHADNVSFDYTVNGRGRTDICREANPPEWCDSLGVYSPTNINYCGPDVDVSRGVGAIDITSAFYRSDFDSALGSAPGVVDLKKVLVLNYNDDRPQGCDLVVKMTVTVDLDNGVKLQGTAEVTNPIRKQKQVYLQSDVLVESGGVKIKQIDPNQSLYTLTAGDTIDIGQSGTDQLKGILEQYGTSEEALFDLIVNNIRTRVNALVIERGEPAPNTAALATTNSPITRYSEADVAKMPEGRIWYFNQGSGEVVLGDNNKTNQINVCAPTTMVVEGRDVLIKNDVKQIIGTDPKSNVCALNGKFGLIVLDGDIYFDGNVESVEGYYFTTGTIYTGTSANPFRLEGVAIAHDFALQRY